MMYATSLVGEKRWPTQPRTLSYADWRNLRQQSQSDTSPAPPKQTRRRRRSLIFVLASVLTLGLIVSTVVLVRNHQAVEARKERIAAEKAADKKAEEERLQAIEDCKVRLGDYMDALAEIDSRLDVGLTADDLGEKAGDAAVEEGQIDESALSGFCLEAKEEADVALTAHSNSASKWDDCIWADYCDPDYDIDLQGPWVRASNSIQKARAAHERRGRGGHVMSGIAHADQRDTQRLQRSTHRSAGTVIRSRKWLQALGVLAMALVLCSCAGEAPSASSTPTVTVTVTQPASPLPAETVTVAAQPAESPSPMTEEVKVSGRVTLLELLTKDLTRHATCQARGIQIEITDASGDIVAIPVVHPVKPTDVDDQPSFISWSCEHTYTSTMTLDSPAYTIRAYLDGLETEYGDSKQTVSRDELLGGAAPYLQLSFAPGVG